MGVELDDDFWEDELQRAPNVWKDFLTSSVRALDPPRPVAVPPAATLREAVDLMNRHKIGSLLVVEGARLLGVFTERDVLSRVVGRLDLATPVGEVMTRNPETVRPDDSIVYALNKMHVGGYRRIPVVDREGRAIGVISVRDVVRHVVSLCPRAILNLPPEPELGISFDVNGGA